MLSSFTDFIERHMNVLAILSGIFLALLIWGFTHAPAPHGDWKTGNFGDSTSKIDTSQSIANQKASTYNAAALRYSDVDYR